ncbi:MAG: hypothetical protein DWI57_15070 [Chloroflexi bacterium]|nr:MAG: hypothetical protein DWI57_15070 [Chloroflexota bacterium]
MTSKIGLWIDHRQAVIVTVTDEGAETERITSNMEKQVRFSTHTADIGSPEDVRDRQFANHLNEYYDDVIGFIRKAESILIFGPGEAKGELEKRLEGEGLNERIVGVEAADKMTDGQIAAKVRKHFLA